MGFYISHIFTLKKYEKNLRELGHTQLVKMVSWSRGSKSQVPDPQSQIQGHKKNVSEILLAGKEMCPENKLGK